MEPEKVVWEQDRTHHELMNGCTASVPGTWWSYEAVWWTCLELLKWFRCVYVFNISTRLSVGFLLDIYWSFV